MFKNYLKITFRNLIKNKVFVFINVLGLGIALACCITAFLNWEYNSNFDTYHVNTDEVYRVNFTRITNGQPIKNGSSPQPLGLQIKDNIAQVEKVVRYFPFGGNLKVNNEIFQTDIAAVDAEFFDLFTYPMPIGSTRGFSDKQSILISEEVKEKHFPGEINPIGQVLTYIDGEKRQEFQIVGVFKKPPQNTSFDMEAFVPYDNVKNLFDLESDDWTTFNNTFVRLKNADEIAVVEEQLQEYVEIQNKAKQDYKVAQYYLDPFQGMSVRAERENIWNHWLRSSLPTSAAIAPGIMAFLLLLLACFNFTNTSIAIANRRIKEIGIRKVLGSNKKQLIAQFLGENILLVFLGLLTGLLIAKFLVPAYSAMWPFLDIQLNLLENMDLLGFLGLLLIFTALLAGSYPSFYVSSFQPTTILRGTVKFSGTNALTRVLLTLQYAISLPAIISGFVFSQNANYQANYDMGFDMETILYAFVKDEQGYNKFYNELRNYDQVKDIAGSRHSIGSSWYTDPIKYESSELDVKIFDVGAGYLQTVGATIVQGRDFKENSQMDKERSVIINQQLANTMGWDNAIDKRIVLRDTIALNVVGVVKDIYFEGGLWNPLEPMLLRYSEQSDYRFISIKTDIDDLVAMKTVMDEKWASIFPDELSTVQFMEERKAEPALVNKNIKTLFLFLGFVAVLLSVIGLFSLVSLNLIKRMKEIGVRKVLGASISNISMKVSREFIIILSFASVLGSIGGFYLTKLLMGSIWTYFVPLNPLPFIISVAILFIASALTIGGKIFKVASVNPAHILRDE